MALWVRVVVRLGVC